MTEKKWARGRYQTLLMGVNNDSEVLKLMPLIAINENYVSQKSVSV